MTQHTHHVPTALRLPEIHNPLDASAIKRIKLGSGEWEWEAMSWFIRRAQEDVNNMSGGERLVLQEELIALARTLYRHTNPPKLDASQLQKVQNKILQHLEALLERGQTMFGPFQVCGWVVCVNKAAKVVGFSEPSSEIPEVVTWDTVKGETPSQSVEICVLHYMNQLLKKFCSSIRRCPNCSKIFLQFRRHAIYCGRGCQSIAATRNIRQAVRKEKGRKGKKTQSPVQTGQREGGLKHGKKGR